MPFIVICGLKQKNKLRDISDFHLQYVYRGRKAEVDHLPTSLYLNLYNPIFAHWLGICLPLG